MDLLTDRYRDQIAGVLSCYDRIVITGTLPQICYAQGMTGYLYHKNIRIFDYAKFAEPFRETLRKNAESLAKENGIEIEFVSKTHVRKESLVQKVLDKRGYAPGLVHILSAMETCETYKPWHNKNTGQTYLKGATSKCLHYYFYFIDEELGLCYVRVPTWCPFRLQIYFNGHNWLASKLRKQKIAFSLVDNAFDAIENNEQAQKLADSLSIEELHKKLDRFAQIYCPVHAYFQQVYHWSVMQAEYATDIVFKQQADLQAIYEQLISTAIHTVKPDNIATFLGRKLHGNYQGEAGNHYHVRIEGTRIKHSMGQVSIKMYDKFKRILRIETTVNNLSFFKHYRTVEHIDGTTSKKYANMKKNIYSLDPLRELLVASNRRYLEFISAIDDRRTGRKNLERLSTPVKENNRNYKGFNFFDGQDLELLLVIIRGEFNIYGFQNKNIRKRMPSKNAGQISRLIKRLRMHGLIRKAKNAYKYYLTKLGKKVIATALKIKELVIIPQLNTV
ncbi:MAG: MarR family transcriptional regulator [Saprospiraceae bacterium]